MAQSLHCAYCGESFVGHRASATYCSASCRVRASRDRQFLCWYCGDRGSQRDHVVPHSLTGDKVRRWSGVDWVECCAECNRILGANLFQTMEERIVYLSGRFRRKHRLTLGRVEWDEVEIMELQGSLRSYVAAAERQYWANWARYNHMMLRVAQMVVLENCATE